MKAAIMQPTFFPWIGYFALIYEVDIFIFLDDVQFSKQSWQQRNKIRFDRYKQERIITVPVSKKKSSSRLIRDIEINEDGKWRDFLLRVINAEYNQAPYFDDIYELLSGWLKTEVSMLGSFNKMVIKAISDYLEFSNVQFLDSSSIPTKEGKVNRLVDILSFVEAKEYLSPVGSFNYIDENNIFEPSGIDLLYQNFTHPTYIEGTDHFITHLSILDLLFEYGKSSSDIIISGINNAYTHQEYKRKISDA